MTALWDAALEQYKRFLEHECIVRGQLRKPAAAKVQAGIGGLNAFLAQHPFLRGVSPYAISQEHCRVLAGEGCASFVRGPAWHWRRATLLTQKNYVCEYCKRTALPSATRSHGLRMEVDHICPKSNDRYGGDPGAAEAWDNLTVACRSCNVVKGQAEVDVFRAELFDLAGAVVRLKSG